MAKRLKKKKSSAKKSAARKPRAARKAPAKKARLRKATSRQAASKERAWHRNRAAFAEIQTTDHRVACDSVGSESSREEARSVHPQAKTKTPRASRCNGGFDGRRGPGHASLPR